MRTLELRENGNKIAVDYVKVTNPNNPSEFLYVEKSIYADIVRHLSREGFSSWLGDLWNGVTTVIGGTVAAVVGGVVGGITGRPVGGAVATSPQANGQPGITVYANPGQQVPAAILPQQNNTALWIGAALLGGIVISKMLR